MLSLLAVVALASAPDWVLADPFTVPPAELQQLSAAEPPSPTGVLVLLDERTHRVDEEGRARRTSRLVWRLDDLDLREGWSITQAEWAPYREERPEIRIRVIEPSGEVLELDPELIAESAARADDGQVLSDRRMLRAALPRLEKGSIVEEQTVWTDSSAFLGDGAYQAYGLTRRHENTRHLVRSVGAPAGHPFTWEVTGEVETTRSRKGGYRTVQVHLLDPEAAPETPDFLPFDVFPVPVLRASSVESWAAAGEDYAALAAPHQDPAGLEQVVARLKDLPLEERIDGAHRFAQSIRYTSVSFGVNAIQPVPPAKVLERGFGDCKDKANLLVTLLAELGIEANIALVSTGYGRDVDERLPSPGLFDHAIVHLPEQGRWLDPTDSWAPASEPLADLQGRRALVIDGKRSRLVQIPWTTAADSVYEQARLYDLTGEQPFVEEVRTAHGGWLGYARRDLWEGLDDAGDDRAAEWFEGLLGLELEEVELTGLDDPKVPVRLRARGGLGVGARFTYVFDDPFPLSLNQAFRDALSPVEERDASALDGRTVDVRNIPHTGRSRARFRLPETMEVRGLPKPLDLSAGGLHFQREVQTLPDGFEVVDTYRAEAHRISVADLRAFVQAVAKVDSSPRVEIAVRGRFAFQDGDVRLAMQQAQASDAPEARLLESDLLASLGWNDIGLEMMDQLIAEHPDVAELHSLRAQSRDRDPLNRYRTPPYDPRGASEDYQRALELGLDWPADRGRHVAALWDLALISEEPRPILERALVLSEQTDGALRPSLLVGLGRCEEALAAVEDVRDEDPSTRIELHVCARGSEGLGAWLRGALPDPVQRVRHTGLAMQTLRLRSDDLYLELLEAAADDPAFEGVPGRVLERTRVGYVAPPEQRLFTDVAGSAIWYLLYEGRWHPDFVHPSLRRRDDLARALRSRLTGTPQTTLSAFLEERRLVQDLTIEGDAHTGWRVDVASPPGSTQLGFVAGEDGRPLLRSLGREPREIGLHVLELLDRGEVEAARSWLGWGPSLGELVPAFGELAGDPPTEALASLASGLALMADASVADLDRFVSEREALADPDLVDRLTAAVPQLLTGFSDRSTPPAERLASLRRVIGGSEDPRLRFLLMGALHEAGEEVPAELLAAIPATHRPVALVLTGDVDGFLAVAEGKPGVPALLWNHAVWELTRQGRLQEAMALSSAHLGSSKELSELHTHALLLAMTGDLQGLRTVRIRAADLAGGVDLLPEEWALVDGHALHHLGLPERARAAFQSVQLSPLDQVLVPEDYR